MELKENEFLVEGAQGGPKVLIFAPLTLGSIRKGGLLKHFGTFASLKNVVDGITTPGQLGEADATKIEVAMDAMMAVVKESAVLGDAQQTRESTEAIFDNLHFGNGATCLSEAFKKVMSLSRFDKVEKGPKVGEANP